MFEIVDCHCHAGKGDGLSGPWDTDAPLAAYLRRARAAGIARSVLLPAFCRGYRAANRALARIVAGNPERFLGFAMIHPEIDRGHAAAMVREAVQLGLVGIKVHRHDARITREICDAARAHRLPILYDVTGEVEVVELLAAQYPDVAFVIPHLGSFADDWKSQRALIDPLSRLENVFADTSGVRRFDVLAEAVRRAGPAKILFGSDGPWLHPGLELAKVRALGLAPRDEALVLGGNLQRVLAFGRAASGSGHASAPLRAASVSASARRS